MAKFKAADRLGRYEIVRFIGAGGMGEVYEARHVDLKRRVAIKILIQTGDDAGDIKRRFVQEGEAAARVQHPHVVTIYDVGTDDGVAYLVMELLEGMDLQERLTSKGVLGDRELVEVFLPVCAAITAAHEAGVFHRDLKPANVFLARNPLGGAPIPKLLDFGISKIAADPQQLATAASVLLGTPQYIAPEQALGVKTANASVDQYALGVMMYQCMSNTLPYTGDSPYLLLNAIVAGGAQPIHQRAPGIDVQLGDVIMRAMARDPSHRFVSVRELARALLPFAVPRTQETWAATFGAARAAHEPEAARNVDPLPEVRPPTAVIDGRALDDLGLVGPSTSATGGTLPRPGAKRPVAALVAGFVLLLVGLGATAWMLGRGEDPAPSPRVAATAAPSVSAPASPVASPSPSPSATPSPSASSSPSVSAPASPVASATPSPSASPAQTATPQPTPSKSKPPHPTVTPSPSTTPQHGSGTNGSPILY